MSGEKLQQGALHRMSTYATHLSTRLSHPSATSCNVYAHMLGSARARRELACAEFGSTFASTDGSNRIRFLASRTIATSRSTSAILKVGGLGRRSVSAGAVRPGATRGRVTGSSNWALRSRSIMACSRKTRSASTRKSSEMGAVPSFSAPLLVLNA